MATVSMTKGAELAGVSKGTVSKALKSGRLSYAEKTDNGYLIDTSELFRVFPPKQKETVAESRSETPSGNSETPINRSEEHTSELQSLMRISYAVICLKKKK